MSTKNTNQIIKRYLFISMLLIVAGIICVSISIYLGVDSKLLSSAGIVLILVAFCFGYIPLQKTSASLYGQKEEIERQYEEIHRLNQHLKIQYDQLEKSNKEVANKYDHINYIIEEIDNLVFRFDIDYNIIQINGAVTKFFHRENAEVVGKPLSELVSVPCIEEIGKLVRQVESTGENARNEITLELETFGEVVFQCFLTSNRISLDESIRLPRNKVTYTLISSDVSAVKKHKDHIHRLVHYDFLTDLPNRDVLVDKLKSYIKESKDTLNKPALICIGLDEFKKLNDTFGHTRGDIILKVVARRIDKLVANKHELFRIGGDEFAILMKNTRNNSQLIHLLPAIEQVFREPINVEGNVLYVSASTGIAVYELHGRDALTLITNANTAMNAIKKSVLVRHAYFKENMKVNILRKIQLENAIRDSIENDELYLKYQPQINSTTGEIRGFEALLRWNSHTLGEVSPVEFIPILESTHQIIEVGYWVLREACKEMKELNRKFANQMTICVNISAIQLMQNDFAESVERIIEETGIEANCLELEITESQIIDALQRVNATMEILTSIGVQIALDDFGTGYSSLNYLRNIRCDVLKIDKSFVDDLENDDHASDVLETIIILAQKLSFDIVAEGVENLEQVKYLGKLGCHFFQGYYFSKPVSKKELVKLISYNNYKKQVSGDYID